MRMKTAVSSGSCSLFATFDMNCPLCKTLVKAGTPHECLVGDGPKKLPKKKTEGPRR
jgi:hypothetical protein